MTMNEKNRRKVSTTEANAMEKCAENLSISEFSRVTGVRIELLRRFINRQVGNIRAETWVSGDQAMIDLFESDEDFHTSTAAQIYEVDKDIQDCSRAAPW